MASWFYYLYYSLTLLQIFKCVVASYESSSNEDAESGSDFRRTNDKREWQYEGMPIAIPDKDVLEFVKNDVTREKPIPPKPDKGTRRIFSADETATVGEYPFMAAILVNNELWCGGVIISTDNVLTAAHCLQLQYNNRFFREYVRMLSVRVGSTNATAGGQLMKVSEIFFHPNYQPQSLQYNYAVLKLHKNLTLADGYIRAVAYSAAQYVPHDTTVTFLGWGSVEGFGGKGGEVLLQRVTLPVYNLRDCQEIYGRNLVTTNNFCAGFISVLKNVCNHDAGGPALVGGEVVGVLSFSHSRCDVLDKPAVFSTVGVAGPWLDNIQERKITGYNIAG